MTRSLGGILVYELDKYLAHIPAYCVFQQRLQGLRIF